MPLHWLILTGEYPPQPGGVSDYTRLVACALAATGDAVQVWAPPAATAVAMEDGVMIHRLPDHFGRDSRAELSRAFKQLPERARVFVQYVPHSFGWKAMNIPFCWWLWSQRHQHEIVIMFHEVATPWNEAGGLGRRCLLVILASVTRIMAWFVGRAARRIYISIPGWEEMLRPLVGCKPIDWLPVPSTMSTQVDLAQVAIRRRELLGDSSYLIGHFGTFGVHIASALRIVLPKLLEENPDAIMLCLGRGSEAFVTTYLAAFHKHVGRVVAAASLSAEMISEHLAACDLLMQPYPDGVSTRRTSVMAALALGLPVLTTAGALTEEIWAKSRAVALADSVESMASLARWLLADRAELARLGTTGRDLYRKQFDLGHTITALRSPVISNTPPDK